LQPPDTFLVAPNTPKMRFRLELGHKSIFGVFMCLSTASFVLPCWGANINSAS